MPYREPKNAIIVRPKSSLRRKLDWSMMLYLLLAAPTLNAQDETFVPDTGYNETPEVSEASPSSTKGSDEDDDNIIKVPKQPDAPPAKRFTAAETQKVCAKYRANLLSVYGEIYKLKNCTRHQIHDQEEIFKFAKQGIITIEVDSKDVAALPIGDHWEIVNAKNRPCSFFNKKYITFSYTDIYFVENCVRKLIPDYETLLEHRKSQGIKSSEVLALNAREFYQIRQGRDVTSVIDREFSKLLEGSAGVDIVPIDEACKGVEGKIVTFYSRMYKIEKCRKREINAEQFTMQRKQNDSKWIELRPEQWVSMPDGKPFDDKK